MAVTVRAFDPLPYYLEPAFKHLKIMQRTCKAICNLAREYRAVNFGFQEILRVKVEAKGYPSRRQ